MISAPVPEAAVVYRACGRRYLTKRSAFTALAREMIRARCGCEDGDGLTSGYTCRYHRLDHYPALVKRLARWIAHSIPEGARDE